MNHKVLLADDSLTIQKVIKITLANQPYDITECSNEDELFQKLPAVQPKIVFLDFNLSEKYTGYDLTAKIKSLVPSAKVLLLLGTFDTVDDALLEKCGASEKIVKPFDSNKFIAICKQLVDSSEDGVFEGAEDRAPEEEGTIEIESEAEDQWQMSHTTEHKFEEPSQTEAGPEAPVNALEKEVSDWGMSVPGVIGERPQTENAGLPPVIGEVKSLDEQRQKASAGAAPASPSDVKLPDNDDLEYPTIEELTSSAKEAPADKPAPTSKLISIDSFAEDRPLELEGNYVPDESDVSSIEAQIRDEVEENLWQADEFEELKKEVSSKIEEMQHDFSPAASDFDETLFRPLDESESIQWSEPEGPAARPEPAFTAAAPAPAGPTLDQAELKQEIEQMVKKYVQEYLDEMFKKNVEKISWEVIPDLAENLIRQELGKISNKIIND